MADYHPLILRAVEGLDKNTGENRRALYERARIALVAQLRGVQPALDESEITRERLALEEAIRKVEAESARKVREEPRPPPAPRAPAPRRDPPPAARPAPSASPPPAPESYTPPPPPPSPPRERPPLAGHQPSLSDQAMKGFRESFGNEPPSSPPAPRPEPPRPEFRRPERPISRPAPPPPPPPPPVQQQPHPLQEYGQLEPDVQPENLWDNAPPPAPVDFDEQRPPSSRPRPQQYDTDDTDEPPPRRAQRQPREPRAYGGLIKVIAIFAAVGILGALAFWQRGPIVGMFSSVIAMVRGSSTPSTPAPRTADPNVRPKIPDRIGQPQTAGPAVAQRVVLYEEDPDDPQGKRSIGSAIWRTEMTAAAPGRPPELMVKADIEVPDRRMQMTWSLRRNTDQSLPASHTIEIIFNMPADAPSGGVQNVPGVLMKQAEQTRGVPLSGLAVKVTPGFFLIGLSAVEADMQRNLQLLKERSWFDIPVVYNNNRRAILAVEKGTPGERAFNEAFAAWKQ